MIHQRKSMALSVLMNEKAHVFERVTVSRNLTVRTQLDSRSLHHQTATLRHDLDKLTENNDKEQRRLRAQLRRMKMDKLRNTGRTVWTGEDSDSGSEIIYSDKDYIEENIIKKNVLMCLVFLLRPLAVPFISDFYFFESFFGQAILNNLV